jgi:hypothetical protein
MFPLKMLPDNHASEQLCISLPNPILPDPLKKICGVLLGSGSFSWLAHNMGMRDSCHTTSAENLAKYAGIYKSQSGVYQVRTDIKYISYNKDFTTVKFIDSESLKNADAVGKNTPMKFITNPYIYKQKLTNRMFSSEHLHPLLKIRFPIVHPMLGIAGSVLLYNWDELRNRFEI